MSLLGFWGQVVEYTSGANAPSDPRKIDGYYVPHDEDSDSDAEAEVDQHVRAVEPEPARQAPTDEAMPSLIRKTEETVVLGLTSNLMTKLDQQAAIHAAFGVHERIVNFCQHTAVTRVAPTEKELEELWNGNSALICNLSANNGMGKAECCESIVSALSEQLAGELGHEWKPQLRALCVLQFYYCKGVLERAIAEAVIDASTELLQHLTTELTPLPCREQALKVMQLSQLAEVAPSGISEMAVASDGGIFVLKATGDEDDDQETAAGSSSCVEASDSQDEQFVASWPSSFQESCAELAVAEPCAGCPAIGVYFESPTATQSPSNQVSQAPITQSVLPIHTSESSSEGLAREATTDDIPHHRCLMRSSSTQASTVRDLHCPVIWLGEKPEPAEKNDSLNAQTASIDTQPTISPATQPTNIISLDTQPTSNLYDCIFDIEPARSLDRQPTSGLDECIFDKQPTSRSMDEFIFDMQPASICDETCLQAKKPTSMQTTGGSDLRIAQEAPEEIQIWPSKVEAGDTLESSGARKVMPVIPWGIEDTLEVPADPFASLLTMSI